MDVIILIGFILETTAPTELELLLSDINEDGLLDVLDVILLVNFILENPS